MRSSQGIYPYEGKYYVAHLDARGDVHLSTQPSQEQFLTVTCLALHRFKRHLIYLDYAIKPSQNWWSNYLGLPGDKPHYYQAFYLGCSAGKYAWLIYAIVKDDLDMFLVDVPCAVDIIDIDCMCLWSYYYFLYPSQTLREIRFQDQRLLGRADNFYFDTQDFELKPQELFEIHDPYIMAQALAYRGLNAAV